MARTMKPPQEEQGGGGGGHGPASGVHRWMVSYADFMTLMFIVFVVMFSFTRVDTVKYERLARSLNQVLGAAGGSLLALSDRAQSNIQMPITSLERFRSLEDVPDWPAYLIAMPETEPTESAEEPGAEIPEVIAEAPPVEAEPVSEPAAEPAPEPGAVVTVPEPGVSPVVADPMEEVAEVFRGMPGVKTGLLSVALEERGIVLSVAGSLLFNPGEYQIRPEAYGILDEIADRLVDVELPIMVTGTADATQDPGSAEAFELAALRAGAVVRYFTEAQGLPGDNFVYFGYGDANTGMDRVTIIVARQRE